MSHSASVPDLLANEGVARRRQTIAIVDPADDPRPSSLPGRQASRRTGDLAVFDKTFEVAEDLAGRLHEAQ